MGLWDRIKLVLKSSINALLRKAENPEHMLDQIIEELNDNMVKVRQKIATVIAEEKKLQKQLNDLRDEIETWERRAILAVQKGADDLAREALKKKALAEQQYEELKKVWEQQHMISEQLKQQYEMLKAKVEEARRKKDVLIARKRKADAQKRINEIVSSIQDPHQFDAFKRMEEKILEYEAQADAESELIKPEGELEDKFKALEAGATDTDIEAQLQALKAKALDRPSHELPPPSVDQELAELKKRLSQQS